MGIDDPQIGMNISLSYQLGTDYQYSSDEFVLSGYYTDYSASRAGNRGAAYVSELFATQTGDVYKRQPRAGAAQGHGQRRYASAGADRGGHWRRRWLVLQNLPSQEAAGR